MGWTYAVPQPTNFSGLVRINLTTPKAALKLIQGVTGTSPRYAVGSGISASQSYVKYLRVINGKTYVIIHWYHVGQSNARGLRLIEAENLRDYRGFLVFDIKSERQYGHKWREW